MELADRTLLDRLQEVCRLGQTGIPRGELLRYTMEAAKVLDFLNKPRHFPERGKPVGIQHGDIKPQNILLVGDGVKVGDFGLISLLEKSVTTHGGGMTPAYAPPEFFAGQVTRWSDQYSLAVTYCHLRGGKPPPSPSATPLENATGETVRDLSMLPAEEQPAVKRALAAVPQRRWPNCRVFVRELANPDKRDRDDRPRGFPPPPSDAPPRRDRVAQVQPEPGIADGPSRQPIPAGLTETASAKFGRRAGRAASTAR
jgi:serine/threonine-protein kinase